MEALAAGVHDRLEVFFVGTNENPARMENARVKTTNGLNVQKALIGDVADQKCNLIHVAEKHDLQRVALGLLSGFLLAQKGAHCIGFDLVKEPLDLFFNERAYAVLVTRCAGGFAKSSQKVDVHGIHVSNMGVVRYFVMGGQGNKFKSLGAWAHIRWQLI